MEKYFPKRVMQLIKSAILSVLAVVTFTTTTLNAMELQPFKAKYSAFQYGKELGEATLQLDALGRNKYRLTYQSKVSVFFLSDKRKEVSLFSWQNDQIVPFKYTYERTGFGSDKEMQAEFDRSKNLITIDKESTIPWNNELDNQLYRLDVQLQLAANKTSFEYDLINNRGKPRHYEMVVVAKESLNLPYGKVEALKVKMIRKNSTRETYAWFAPKLNYQLVRLKQFKDGDEQGDIQLAKYTKN